MVEMKGDVWREEGLLRRLTAPRLQAAGVKRHRDANANAGQG